jgi:hypothetical protein
MRRYLELVMRQARDAASLVCEVEICLSFHRGSKLHESRIQPPIGKPWPKRMMLKFDRFIEAISHSVTSCHFLDWLTPPKFLTRMQLNNGSRRRRRESPLQFVDPDINAGYTRLTR